MKPLIAAVVALAFVSTASARNMPGDIVLGGDVGPDRVKATYQASCGRHVLVLHMQSDRHGATVLVDVDIDGKSYNGTSEYAELQSFMATLIMPYVTDIKCPADAISVSVAGRSRTASETAFRITFPIP